MPDRLEFDDADLFVGGVQPDAESREFLIQAIAESRSRPEHAAELAEAVKILAGIEVDHIASGAANSQETLEYRRRRVADLTRVDPEKNGGVVVAKSPQVSGRPE